MLTKREHIPAEFEFHMDKYVVLAQWLSSLDENLEKKRTQLIPDLIEENDFWCNYFFKI